MRRNTYFVAVFLIFITVTVLHFLRILWDWPARIGTWDVPMWLSWLAVLLAGALAYQSYRLRKMG
ncbi:MAG: hypothetical protein A3D92_22220 [Bacteroidetes bacterium RIFCSPHIGHO2_02_FULL_44_7]|nr:MAG: hypothetical protein A3D92_22220 [Bacteroidetes bacterium RIFCSPHIGHO2_02_FULL_44_7]